MPRKSWLDVSITHEQAIRFVAPLAVAAGAISLVFAIVIRFNCQSLLHPYGYIVLGLWTLTPPLWFMFEWGLVEKCPSEKKEIVKHYHELCRNFWLALIVVLGAIMGVTDWFKIG